MYVLKTQGNFTVLWALNSALVDDLPLLLETLRNETTPPPSRAIFPHEFCSETRPVNAR